MCSEIILISVYNSNFTVFNMELAVTKMVSKSPWNKIMNSGNIMESELVVFGNIIKNSLELFSNL